MKVYNNRYQLIKAIGAGSQGKTYLALDNHTNEKVVLKELAIGSLENWKSLELFERETRVLQSLNHPGIPRYIDHFNLEEYSGTHYYIVQEFVDGADLEVRLNRGQRWDEAGAKKILKDVLGILEYLHQLSPPVIHRDIKPSNIIQREDGTIVLIDFGCAKDFLSSIVGGSTMGGTPGYLPMEQLMGQAVSGSDIFALGATLVRLLSRRRPSELPIKRGKLQLDGLLNVSLEFQKVLQGMTEPLIEDRLTATELRAPVSTTELRDPVSTTELRALEEESLRRKRELLMDVGVSETNIDRILNATDTDIHKELNKEFATAMGMDQDEMADLLNDSESYSWDEERRARWPIFFITAILFACAFSYGLYSEFTYKKDHHVDSKAFIVDKFTELSDESTNYMLVINYGEERKRRGQLEVTKRSWVNINRGQVIWVNYNPKNPPDLTANPIAELQFDKTSIFLTVVASFFLSYLTSWIFEMLIGFIMARIFLFRNRVSDDLSIQNAVGGNSLKILEAIESETKIEDQQEKICMLENILKEIDEEEKVESALAQRQDQR